ncbi:MAG: response regulator, partial [Candidatus Sulfotelmatobacter sp.]
MKSILFADDSPVIRTTLRHIFEEKGWICRVALNGQDAVDAARESRPDVIVLDLSMPIMNGLTAASILKEVLPTVPFTSFGSVLNSRDLARAGFSALIG